jgi:hypothetical protein
MGHLVIFNANTRLFKQFHKLSNNNICLISKFQNCNGISIKFEFRMSLGINLGLGLGLGLGLKLVLSSSFNHFQWLNF